MFLGNLREDWFGWFSFVVTLHEKYGLFHSFLEVHVRVTTGIGRSIKYDAIIDYIRIKCTYKL